jgi:hypothetical protein
MFIRNGFNAFIPKPVNIVRLDVELNIWVRDRQSEETLSQAEEERTRKNMAVSSIVSAVRFPEGSRVEGLDLAAGISLYGNAADFLRILRSYSDHTPKLLEKMRDLSKESLRDYAITVHGLRGSSFGICADSVANFAGRLEQAAKDGDFEAVMAGNGDLIERVARLISGIRELLRKISDERREKPRLDKPDSSLMKKLLKACEHFDYSSMEKTLGELESYDYDSGADLVVWLRDRADNLEYNEIKGRIAKELSLG